LGRIPEETPFVLEWLVKQGIEVLSTKEGQQRIDNQMDKLMNYMRFWQAGGESDNISIRTKEGIATHVQNGLYSGGTLPIGYRLVHKGRTNKKNFPVYDIEIDPHEAAIVKIVFEKYVYEGYGFLRIADYLDSKGLVSSEGKRIKQPNIGGILKTSLYIGIMTRGSTSSDVIDELRILDDEIFLQAQKLRQAKAEKVAKQTQARRELEAEEGQPSTKQGQSVPLTTRGKSLLSGNLFCDCCGGKCG
jgi:DNA invertase Pin-like site-specific DNA recombinase